MSENLVKLMSLVRQRKDWSPEEQRAALKTAEEAKRAGATVANVLGGISPSLALGVYRRDEWRCKRCGGRDDLGIHHKGGIPASPWLRMKGKRNDFNNLVVLCRTCHSTIHEEAKDAPVQAD